LEAYEEQVTDDELIKDRERREKLEKYDKNAIYAIVENRQQHIIETMDKLGVKGFLRHLRTAPDPLGYKVEWRNVMESLLTEWSGYANKETSRIIKRNSPRLLSARDPLWVQKKMETVQEYWTKHAVKLTGKIDQQTIWDIEYVLAKAIQLGMSTPETIKYFNQMVPNHTFTTARVENIVRTETGKAYAMGSLQSIYENSEIVRYVQFRSIPDDRVTDMCMYRNGLIIPINEFAILGANTPPLHYQCRSRLVPYIKMKPTEGSDTYGYDDDRYVITATRITTCHPPMAGFGTDTQDLEKLFKTDAVRDWLIKDDPWNFDLYKVKEDEILGREVTDPFGFTKNFNLPNYKKGKPHKFTQYIDPQRSVDEYVMPDKTWYINNPKTDAEAERLVKEVMEEYCQFLQLDDLVEGRAGGINIGAHGMHNDALGNCHGSVTHGIGPTQLNFGPEFEKTLRMVLKDRIKRKKSVKKGSLVEYMNKYFHVPHDPKEDVRLGTIHHEMGHAIAFWIKAYEENNGPINGNKTFTEKMQSMYKKKVEALTKSFYRKKPTKAFVKKHGGEDLWAFFDPAIVGTKTTFPQANGTDFDPRECLSQLVMGQELSFYGCTTHDEMIAESWDEYRQSPGGANARKWAKEVGDLMAETVRKIITK
jgi:SPP1 gp7 family putative phage head morphogenesis protein